MENPMRVLIVENRESEGSIAQQLLDNFDLEFSCQRVACSSELREVTLHFNPSLVYRADILPADSRSDAVALLYLMCLRTAVIHITQTDDKSGALAGASVALRLKQPKKSRSAMAAGKEDESTRHHLPALLGVGGNAVVLSESAGWITYANIAASGLLSDSRALDWNSARPGLQFYFPDPRGAKAGYFRGTNRPPQPATSQSSGQPCGRAAGAGKSRRAADYCIGVGS